MPQGKRGRRSIRLAHFDYSQPATYFITICTHRRQPLFGRVRDERVGLSPAGEIVREEWEKTSELRPEVELDEYVILPNHMHAIIRLLERSKAPTPTCAFPWLDHCRIQRLGYQAGSRAPRD